MPSTSVNPHGQSKWDYNRCRVAYHGGITSSAANLIYQVYDVHSHFTVTVESRHYQAVR